MSRPNTFKGKGVRCHRCMKVDVVKDEHSLQQLAPVSLCLV